MNSGWGIMFLDTTAQGEGVSSRDLLSLGTGWCSICFLQENRFKSLNASHLRIKKSR